MAIESGDFDRANEIWSAPSITSKRLPGATTPAGS